MRKILTNCKEFYDSNPKASKALFLFCFFISFFFISPFLNVILEVKPHIQDFSSHVISNATIYNFDVSKRISLYYWSLAAVFILTPIVFFSAFIFFRKRYTDITENQKDFTLISNLSLLGIACIFASFFLVNVDFSVLFLVFLCGYLLLNINQSRPHWNKANGFWILIASLPFSVLLYQIVRIKFIRTLEPITHFRNLELPFSKELVIFFMAFFAIALILHQFLKWFFKNTNDENQKRERLFYATIPLSLVLIFQSLFLELFNILNVRIGFVFKNPKLLLTGLIVIGILISIVSYKRISKKERIFKNNILKKYHFTLFIITLGFIASQPWSMISPENEFFEAANHGLSIDHFFRYGSIPLIENFDAHMLSNQLFPYLYGFLNGYEPWAPLLYLSYTIIFNFLIVYLLFKKILGSEYALLLCLCFPLLGLVNNYYIFTGIIGLLLVTTINSTSRNKFYWFWGGIVFLCIYKLDIGFSSCIGGVLAYILVKYLTRKPLEFKKFILAGIISFMAALLLFVMLCLLKSVNPIKRLHEFVLLAMSNQNWAFKDLGDPNHIVFRIIYHVLPLLVIFLLGKVVLKSLVDKAYVAQILKTKQTQAAFILFIYFALNFYFNIPRGIVRHSFLFGITINMVSTIPLALMAFIFIKDRKNNFLIFLSTFFGIYLVANLNKPTFKATGASFFSEAMLSASYNEKYSDGYEFRGTRIRESFSLSEIKYFKGILDEVLKPGETYIDLASVNFYYALVARKNPTYVNQSPLLLNGDDSQRMALEEIMKANVPLAIVPTKENLWKGIDGVPVDFKYYILSEYVYKNYTPLLSMSNFDIYVLKNKKAAFQNKLKNNQSSTSNFSETKIENFIQNDIRVEKTADNKLILKAGGKDPFVFGFLGQLKEFSSFNRNAPVKIKIKIETTAPGSVQLFYLKEGEPNFMEESSQSYPIANAGKHELVLDLVSFPKDLRIDVDLPELVIEEISFSSESSSDVAKITAEIPNYNLGNIPLVWGEKSDKELFSKVKKLKEEISQTSFVIDSRKIKKRAQPFYLFVDMKSDSIQALKVELFNDKNEKKGEYIMATRAFNQKIALRISTNYYWWNDKIAKIVLTSEKPIIVSRLALISEDGSEQISYEDTGFSLSNINDDYWFNGVSKQSNILLFNNFLRLLRTLQSARQLEFIDGSRVTIKNVTEVGTYIHVEIVENLEPFKIAASSPNEVKMIK